MKKLYSFDLRRLRKLVRPYRLHWFSRLRSTNDHAARLRGRGELFAPAIVLAGSQFAGRGRNSNSWWSGRGCITATFVVPIDPRLLPHQLPLIAGVAVRNALTELTADQSIELKWPNDLMYGTRKVAGILCERVHRADLIGLGLNVNLGAGEGPANLRNRITSLSRIARIGFDKTDTLAAIVRELHPMLSRRAEFPFHAVLREYDRSHVLRGRNITVRGVSPKTSLTGTCHGLDSMGRLLVRQGNRLVPVVTGQVQMR